MSQTVAELFDAALGLAETERAELAELLTASLTDQSGTMHPAWTDELRRRAAEIDSGKVRPIPWAEVQRRAKAQLDAGEQPNG